MGRRPQTSTRVLTLGRDPSVDITVGHTSVSRRHAELRLARDGRLFVTDRNSSNGTFVVRDGVVKRIRQAAVSLEATLRFGDVEISARSLASHFPASSPADEPPGRHLRCACGAVARAGSHCAVCGAHVEEG